jgi:hypothetical protein
LLNDPENLVLIFPQGKLFSNFIDEVSFEKGLVKILQGVTGKFQTVYAATFIEGLQYKKPSVNVYLATAEAVKAMKILLICNRLISSIMMVQKCNKPK